MLGKHNALEEVIKALSKQHPDDKFPSAEQDRPR